MLSKGYCLFTSGPAWVISCVVCSRLCSSSAQVCVTRSWKSGTEAAMRRFKSASCEDEAYFAVPLDMVKTLERRQDLEYSLVISVLGAYIGSQLRLYGSPWHTISVMLLGHRIMLITRGKAEQSSQGKSVVHSDRLSEVYPQVPRLPRSVRNLASSQRYN